MSKAMTRAYRRPTDRPEVSTDERREAWLFGICRQVDVACSEWLQAHGIRIDGTASHRQPCDVTTGATGGTTGELGEAPATGQGVKSPGRLPIHRVGSILHGRDKLTVFPQSKSPPKNTKL
jgi:hypothetical protein